MKGEKVVWDIIDQTNSKITKKLDGLYHYTSVDALYHIINNQCLFASHLKYLNDYKEYNTGYEALYKYIAGKKINEGGEESDWFLPHEFNYLPDKSPLRSGYSAFCKAKNGDNEFAYIRDYYLRSILPEVFIISFCNNGDSLNNWIAYAKENGVSIEFNFEGYDFIDKSLDSEAMQEEIVTKKGVREEDYQSIVELTNCFPREIFYVKDDKELEIFMSKNLNNLISIFQNDPDQTQKESCFWYWLALLFAIVPFMKIGGFENEQELRMAVRANRVTFGLSMQSKVPVGNIIKYREKNSLLIPYMEIGWKNGEQKSLPIESITVGPGKNQKMIFESIIHFIESKDFPVIPFEDEKEFGNYHNGVYKTHSGIAIKMSTIPFIF